MAFWSWYASVNDDVRTELIDKAWFGQNHAETPMQDAIKKPAPAQSSEQIAPEVYGKAPNTSETIHQLSLHGEPDNNPQSTKEAIEAVYGTGNTPNGTELGGDFQAEADYAAQQDQVAEISPPQHEQEQEL